MRVGDFSSDDEEEQLALAAAPSLSESFFNYLLLLEFLQWEEAESPPPSSSFDTRSFCDVWSVERCFTGEIISSFEQLSEWWSEGVQDEHDADFRPASHCEEFCGYSEIM